MTRSGNIRTTEKQRTNLIRGSVDGCTNIFVIWFKYCPREKNYCILLTAMLASSDLYSIVCYNDSVYSTLPKNETPRSAALRDVTKFAEI